jgi:hypothetical protein
MRCFNHALHVLYMLLPLPAGEAEEEACRRVAGSPPGWGPQEAVLMLLMLLLLLMMMLMLMLMLNAPGTLWRRGVGSSHYRRG